MSQARDKTTDIELPHPKPGRAWDESTIRAALAAMLLGKTEWPTYQEFSDAGAKGLQDAVNRFGGPDSHLTFREQTPTPGPSRIEPGRLATLD